MKNITLLLLFISFITFGQNQTVDVLYLKNGSIIKGSITEMNPSENIKIQTADGSLFVYEMSNVLKLEKEEIKNTNQNTPINNFEDLTESKAKEVVNALFTNVNLSENIQVVGVTQWNSELRKESSSYRYIVGSVQLKVFSYGKWKTSQATTFFKFKRIDGEWYIKDIDDNYKGAAYVPYGRWSRGIYKKVSDVKQNAINSQVNNTENSNSNAVLDKLDWSREDVEPKEFTNRYYLVNDIPIFSYGNVKYSLKKAEDFKGRNDVAISVESMLYKAIESTGRKLVSEKSQFTNSKNKVNVSFTLNTVKFRFVETGYQCEISLIANVEGQYNEPTSLSFDYNTVITAKSNRFKRNMSKEQSLNSAIDNFKANVRAFIFQYEPIQIDLKSIGVNKRGKVDYIVFDKPSNFIDTNKMKFVVLKPSDLKVENNKYKLSGKVGDCTFKGKIVGNEIHCNVTGGKNKEAFANYLNSDEILIGISSY